MAPVVAASNDASVVGSPFLVMGWVDGETIARRILRDDEFAEARAVLVGQCARALAAIHDVAVGDAPHLRAEEPVGQLRQLIDGLGQPHPAFELALRWLEEHRPAPGESTVVARRLPAGQPHGGRRRVAGGARLGAGAPG